MITNTDIDTPLALLDAYYLMRAFVDDESDKNFTRMKNGINALKNRISKNTAEQIDAFLELLGALYYCIDIYVECYGPENDTISEGENDSSCITDPDSSLQLRAHRMTIMEQHCILLETFVARVLIPAIKL